jgi:hypothetical protein
MKIAPDDHLSASQYPDRYLATKASLDVDTQGLSAPSVYRIAEFEIQVRVALRFDLDRL